jgi:predicted lipoprotein
MFYRYRVKVNVVDGLGAAMFVIFDGDIEYLLGGIKCSSLVAATKVTKI